LTERHVRPPTPQKNIFQVHVFENILSNAAKIFVLRADDVSFHAALTAGFR
jgi:hypothetical protein